MSKELMVIENMDLVDFFTRGDSVDQLLSDIEKKATSIVHDISTPKGRKAVTANVTLVTSTKTYLESEGKSLAAEYKLIPTKIDKRRKKVKDFLSALQVRVRAPLTEWEAEEKAKEDAAAFAILLDCAHEMNKSFNTQREIDYQLSHEQAIVDNEKFDIYTKEQNQIRIDREAEIARAAAENARITAELEAKAKIELAERERKNAIEQAERQRVASENAAIELKKQKEQAATDAILKANRAEAKRIKDIATEIAAEKERQAAIQEAQYFEKKKREANQALVTAKCTEAKIDLMKFLTEEQAILVVKAIRSATVRNMSMNF